MRHPVPCDFITKEKIKEFLNKRIKEVAKPEDLRAEELTLKKFGLVPPDFDLAKNTVELLTEQAAAFYDYDKKKLFITDTTSSETQEPVLSHEIAHAIADQNYNLAKFIKAGRKSDDGATARLAVMEGQATWLMSELLARKMGQSLKDSPALLAMMSGATEGGAGQYPVFDNAPLYLRLTLVFPYTKGMLFQNAVFDRDGTERIRRGLPASLRSPRSRFSTRRNTSAASSPPIRNFPSLIFPKATRAWWADRSANWSIDHAGTVFRQGARRRNRAALARLRLRPAGEQEGRPRRAALRRGVGQRRRRPPVFRRLSPAALARSGNR